VRAAFTEIKTYFSYELWTPSVCSLYVGLAKQGTIVIKRGRVIRARPGALWSKKSFPLSLSPAVQIYWTVLNKSSQVTENTRSVSAVKKIINYPCFAINKKKFAVPANRKDIMYIDKNTYHQRNETIEVSGKSKLILLLVSNE
jgi:hypothetical protein